MRHVHLYKCADSPSVLVNLLQVWSKVTGQVHCDLMCIFSRKCNIHITWGNFIQFSTNIDFESRMKSFTFGGQRSGACDLRSAPFIPHGNSGNLMEFLVWYGSMTQRLTRFWTFGQRSRLLWSHVYPVLVNTISQKHRLLSHLAQISTYYNMYLERRW